VGKRNRRVDKVSEARVHSVVRMRFCAYLPVNMVGAARSPGVVRAMEAAVRSVFSGLHGHADCGRGLRDWQADSAEVGACEPTGRPDGCAAKVRGKLQEHLVLSSGQRSRAGLGKNGRSVPLFRNRFGRTRVRLQRHARRAQASAEAAAPQSPGVGLFCAAFGLIVQGDLWGRFCAFLCKANPCSVSRSESISYV